MPQYSALRAGHQCCCTLLKPGVTHRWKLGCQLDVGRHRAMLADHAARQAKGRQWLLGGANAYNSNLEMRTGVQSMLHERNAPLGSMCV